MISPEQPNSNVIHVPVLDWSTTPFEVEYKGHYLKIIDGVYTPEECASLIALAESGDEWKQAEINYGLAPHEKFINMDYRNGERILRFDEDAAGKIYERLLPYVQEFVELKPGNEWHSIVDRTGKLPGIWKLVGVNERLSFLRYKKGGFFRSHCDTELELPDGRMSRVTIQIYLGEDGVQGGATRISGQEGGLHFDVEPKKGRVLIFQQRGIYHAGEDVIEGVKYCLRSDFMFRYSERTRRKVN